MKLYLMQHAPAYPATENPERPVTPEGVQKTRSAAEGMKKLGIHFDLIISSTKRRAQQTAALLAEGLRYAYSDILSSEALLPNADTRSIMETLATEKAQQVLLVGHLPHLEKLTEELLEGGSLIFSNCGLCCLELSEAGPARLLFHLQPEHLRA